MPPIQKKHHLHKLYKNLKRTIELDGDIAECGVGFGGTAQLLSEWLQKFKADKVLHLFDTFTGMPDLLTQEERDIQTHQKQKKESFNKVYKPLVGGNVGNPYNLGLPENKFIVHAGLFSDTLPTFDTPLCFIHIDPDLYVSTCQALDMMNRLLVVGGCAIVHDYENREFPGIKLAIREKVDFNKYELEEHTHQAILTRKA